MRKYIKKLYLLLLVLVALIFLPRVNYAASIQCPYTLAVTEFVSAQNGWPEYKINSAKTLRSATIYVGSLGDTSSALAPDEQQQRTQLIQRWDLQSYWKNKENVWLECKYFETSVVISRNIPVTAKQCIGKVQLDKNHNAVGSSNIICE